MTFLTAFLGFFLGAFLFYRFLWKRADEREEERRQWADDREGHFLGPRRPPSSIQERIETMLSRGDLGPRGTQGYLNEELAEELFEKGPVKGVPPVSPPNDEVSRAMRGLERLNLPTSGTSQVEIPTETFLELIRRARIL